MISFQEQLLTIPSDLCLINMGKDPYYRYKMPELKLKYQKQSTILFNLAQVSSSLSTPPDSILMYLSQKLKTISDKSIFKKRTEYRLKGFYEPLKLQKTLDNYILEYVLCKTCLYPQLRYRNSSASQPYRLTTSCNSCGSIQIFHDASKSKTLKSIYDNPFKKTEQDLFQEEQDRVYGNKEIQFVSESQESESS